MRIGLPVTPTVRQILEAIEQAGEVNGGDLSRQLEESSRNTVYRYLDRLEQVRWLQSRIEKVVELRTRPLRLYRLSAIGEKVMEICRMYDDLDSSCREEER